MAHDERGQAADGGSHARRYSEEEVEAIFAEATRAVQSTTPARSEGHGLTLADLHEIGREIGVDANAITRAATALEVGGQPQPRRRYLGFPIGVGRTVELPGPLSDREWERLVADLRETFRARGNVRTEGSLREWWNGNLHALVEPTGTGERLRMRTVSSRVRAAVTMGVGGLVTGIVFTVVLALTGDVLWSEAALIFGVLGAIGVWGLGFGAIESFRWSRERERQMEDIGHRAVALAAESGSGSAAVTPPGPDGGPGGMLPPG